MLFERRASLHAKQERKNPLVIRGLLSRLTVSASPLKYVLSALDCLASKYDSVLMLSQTVMLATFLLRSFLPLLLLESSLGDYAPFREPSLLQRSVLLPRKQIGVGVAIQYETCEEQYGEKFSDCYQGCYDTSTGQTCCKGDCTLTLAGVLMMYTIPRTNH